MVLSPITHCRRIRRLTYNDLEVIAGWDKDPEINRLTGRMAHEKDEMNEWWNNMMRDPSRMNFAITDNDGNLIGDVALEQIIWRTREAELRISIGNKAYWGLGYGTEAVMEVVALGFFVMHLDRIYLRVQEDNVRAIRSYLKAGFRKVARLVANGRLHGTVDLVLMEMSREG